jgi:hypothetical protein
MKQLALEQKFIATLVRRPESTRQKWKVWLNGELWGDSFVSAYLAAGIFTLTFANTRFGEEPSSRFSSLPNLLVSFLVRRDPPTAESTPLWSQQPDKINLYSAAPGCPTSLLHVVLNFEMSCGGRVVAGVYEDSRSPSLSSFGQYIPPLWHVTILVLSF